MRQADPTAHPRNLVLPKVQVIEGQWRHQRKAQDDSNVTQRKEKWGKKKLFTGQNVEDHQPNVVFTDNVKCRKSFRKPETEVYKPSTKIVDINWWRRQKYKKSTSFRRIWAFKIPHNEWCDDEWRSVTYRHRCDVFQKTLLTFPPFEDQYIKFYFNWHHLVRAGMKFTMFYNLLWIYSKRLKSGCSEFGALKICPILKLSWFLTVSENGTKLSSFSDFFLSEIGTQILGQKG